VGAVSEAVQRAVGEDGSVEEGHPFVQRAVTRDDRGGPPMALDEHIVEIARLLGGELPPQFPLEGVIGPGLMERLRSARVTTALRLSTTSRRGTPPKNLHAASRPSRTVWRSCRRHSQRNA
jgi:hypothetical protein